jgi:2-iminobutanoate/2-iminopropanoate deaminase
MKTIITTDKAPQPIGPYNQAVLNNGMLYTSGQIALDPKTGQLHLEDISSETKSTIFISDMDNFGKINDVYGSYFDDATAPARETVQVARLPKDVNVEISVIASL